MGLGWPVLGKRALDDGLYARLAWKDCAGLVEPVVPLKGQILETYGGANRVQTGPHVYAARQLQLYGYLVNSLNGYNEAWEQAHDFFTDVYGRPSWLQIGNLVLDVEIAPPTASQMRAHRRAFDWRADAEAVPATWRAIGGYLAGAAQSIYAVDDAPARATYALSGNPVEFNNVGTAQTEANLILSGLTASTIYWLRNTHLNAPAKTRFRTDANGIAYLAPSSGVLLAPGTNWLRIETDAGALVGGTPKWGFYGTTFRYLGNSGNQFAQYPVLHFFSGHKRLLATADSGTSITTIEAFRPGIGLPLGTWTAAKQGLVIEGASRNTLVNSEDFSAGAWIGAATVTVNDAVAPDGATTADKIEDTDPGSAQSRYQIVSIPNDSTWWTGSVYLKKIVGAPTTFPRVSVACINGGNVEAKIRINLQTGATYTFSGPASAQVNVYSVGDYWRVCIAIANNSSGNNQAYLEIHPATSATIDGAEDPTQTGSVHAWGADLQNDPWPTSYTPAGASGPNYDRFFAGVGVYVPRNYLLQSHDLSQVTLTPTVTGPWVRHANLTVARNVAAMDGTASACTLTLASTSGWIYQAVTPNIRPNSSDWRMVWVLKRGTITGANSVKLNIEDQSGAVLATATVTGNDLSADDWTAWTVRVNSGDIPASVTGFRIALLGNVGTGTVLVDSVIFAPGNAFRLPLRTTTAASIPYEGTAEWVESMSQNGFIQFKALLPPRNTGEQAGIISDNYTNESHLRLFRSAGTAAANNYLTIVRKHNAGSVNIPDIDVGNVWNDAMHTYRIQWRNYTNSAGTQIMDLKLDIDGVNKYDSGNVATASVTSWSAPSRLTISDGTVYAVLRELTVGTPTIPDGAVAA